MPDHSMLYSKEVTDQTLKELVEFITWYNKHVGHDPLIVGGWAAWAYHHGLGSKDIDVVFPAAPAMHVTLNQYFIANGYRERKTAFFSYEFYKTRKTSGGREVEVIVDAVASDRRVIVGGTPITIPWGLAEKHKQRHEFGKDAQAWIIAPELLLIYKIGALIGRDHNLGLARAFNFGRIQGKLWKDAQDILGLTQNAEFNEEKLGSLLEESGLNDEKLLRQAKSIALSYLEGKQATEFNAKWAEILE